MAEDFRSARHYRLAVEADGFEAQLRGREDVEFLDAPPKRADLLRFSRNYRAWREGDAFFLAPMVGSIAPPERLVGLSIAFGDGVESVVQAREYKGRRRERWWRALAGFARALTHRAFRFAQGASAGLLVVTMGVALTLALLPAGGFIPDFAYLAILGVSFVAGLGVFALNAFGSAQGRASLNWRDRPAALRQLAADLLTPLMLTGESARLALPYRCDALEE